MRTGFKILLGCLAAPFVLLLVLVLIAIAFRSSGPPEHRPESADIDQPLTAVTPEQLAAEGLTGGTIDAPLHAVQVNIRMEEGNFIIKPGPPGSHLRVEGDYDAGVYELKQDLSRDASGAPVYNLTFLPRYSLFRRVLTEGSVHIDSDDNAMTVHLPQGVPMALRAQISKGVSDVQLGGLSLESAALELTMGEHKVAVDEPNPLQMTTLEINARMGESRFSGLGNLRAESMTVWGRMGEIKVMLGDIARDTKLFARMRMGEMTLGLPARANVKTHTSTFLGDTTGSAKGEDVGFLLDVDAGAMMGELKYLRGLPDPQDWTRTE